MWFMEEPSKFSAGHTEQILTYSVREKPGETTYRV